MSMLKVLIVDDSPADVRELTELLTRRGHAVIPAGDAKAGMQAARDHQPNLVLMDIVMPGISGFQATRQLTQATATSHIPIILVSSKDHEVDRIWGRRQGARGYVTKPVREADLYAAIDSAVG